MKARRNIGIVAHIDAGKTTLTEQILHGTGVLRRPGAVEDGSTVSDWRRQEQERGITIGSAAVVCRWDGVELTLIDTPGHVDFCLEVSRALTVLDGTVVIFSGAEGVQAQTQTVWHQVAHHELPAIGFVNKLDRPGYDDEALVASIRERMGIDALPLQIPLTYGGPDFVLLDVLTGQKMCWRLVHKKSGVRSPEVSTSEDEHEELLRQIALERIADAVASSDDVFAERYLAGDSLDRSDWLRAIARATAARRVLPLVYGIARSGVGPAQLLDAVVHLLPAPDQAPSPQVFMAETGAPAGRHDSELPAAFVFKTERRRGGRRLAFIRVFSGTFRQGDVFRVVPSGQEATPVELVRLMGSEELAVPSLEAGTVGALVLSGDAPLLQTGHTLTVGSELSVTFESVLVPTPVIAVSLEAVDAEEDGRMRHLLEQLVHDDPSLTVLHDRDTGQTLLAGMGELHLELALEQLQQEEGLHCRVGQPRPRSRHMIGAPHKATGRSIQDGPPRGRVEVTVSLTPSDHMDIQPVSYEATPQLDVMGQKALEAGVIHALNHEADVVGADATIHAVELAGGGVNPRLLWDAGYVATQLALDGAGVHPAEPWMTLTIAVPETSVGRVSGDLARRRAKILGSESRGALQVLRVEAPLAEMIHYATALRSLTSGRGSFTMSPSRFRICP